MKASINLAISLDGFIARQDGDVSWFAPYQDDGGFADFFRSVDCLLMGRRSFKKILSFGVDWPYGDKRLVVLNRTDVQIPSDLRNTTERMSGFPIDVLATLKKRGFAHLYIDGGLTIRGFLEARLIDTFILARVLVILGSGISLFDGLRQEIDLDHKVTRSFASGLVQSEYRVVNDTGKGARGERGLKRAEREGQM